MSLISTKNLSAPIVNKVHLVGILLVVVLFATFRLAGGTIKTGGVQDSSQRAVIPSSAVIHSSAVIPSSAAAPSAESFLASENRVVGGQVNDRSRNPVVVNGAAPSRAASSSSVQDLIAESEGSQKRAAPAEQRRQDGDLADIERQLGLR